MYVCVYIYRVINHVITTIVAIGGILFVILAWKAIHFGRNPWNGGSPPEDNSDMNIMNFLSAVSLFVIMVWLMSDAQDSLIADTTVSAIYVYEGRKCTIT